MAVFEILNNQSAEETCTYNGTLSDYVADHDIPDPAMKEAFLTIAEQDPEVRIITGLKGSVARDAISNRIIHYRDIGKLDGTPVIYPYIIYSTSEKGDRAMLVIPFETYGYLFARGYYYCLSEVGGDFYDVRNEILEVSSDQPDQIVSWWNRLAGEKPGVMQRQLDRAHFRNYDELKETALKAGQELTEKADAELREMDDRSEAIRGYVVRWFLLKKLLYVQYMVNKNIRASVHDGDIHKQRNQARLNAEEVPFMSYRTMWTIGTEDDVQ